MKPIKKEMTMVRTIITYAILPLLSFLLPCMGMGQTGIITGTITDDSSGKPLQGAELLIEAIGKQVTTDRDGRYIFRGVPAGTTQVLIHLPGYISQQVRVQVNAGERAEQRVVLEREDTAEGPAYMLAVHRNHAQARARMKHSGSGHSIITSEQMDRFGDQSIRDAMVRVPGVQVGAGGEVNLRGAGLHRYMVSVDGQRMATTGLGDRSVDLGMLPVDLFRDLEVIKVLSPDMEADAMSGVVNLGTYHPVGGDRSLGVTLGGGANTGYFGFTGPGSRASVRYSETLTDELALGINLTHQMVHRSGENLEIEYDTADFGEGLVDVVERVSSGLRNDTRSSTGGGLQLTYQPTLRTTYHVRGMIISSNRQVNSHTDNFVANRDWINPGSTGAMGSQGYYRHDAILDEIKTHHLMMQGGASHLFQSITLKYGMDWSRSQINKKYYTFPFIREGMNYDIEMLNRSRTMMSATSQQFLMDDGSIDRRFITMRPFERRQDDHVENSIIGRLDLEIPFVSGSIKLGSSARLTKKDGEFDQLNLQYPRNFNMTRFATLEQRNVEILDHYTMYWLIDQDAARHFLNAQIPVFSYDEGLNRRMSDIWNHDATELVYSGYGNATIEARRISLQAGARLEHTNAHYNGKTVSVDESDLFESSTNINGKNSYTNLFPSVGLTYGIGYQTRIRLGYFRSISRPDFHMLAPFELANRQDTTLFRGNPALDPVLANNLDFRIDFYPGNLGLVSAGVFYKQLSNFVIVQNRSISVSRGDFTGFDPMFGDGVTSLVVQESGFQNSDETAEIYGIELSWEQTLTFLPGFLSNLGTYVNYTWTEAVFETQRDEDTVLPYQSPHVVNAAVDYTQGRFFTRISYHRSAASLISHGQQGLSPSTHGTRSVYLDHYQDGWSDLSVSFRFRISDNFRFWADASNLLRKEQILYQNSREFYPVQIDYNRGLQFRMGIRFDL